VGTSLAVGHRVAYWATLQPDRPAGGTSGRGNDHEVLIRVLTGNIRPYFSRRPDESSTALHHHLANRDHWHHKETGVDRGPAIIAPGFTRIATTAQRAQRRFLTDRGRAPRLAKVTPAGTALQSKVPSRCIGCMLIMRIAVWGESGATVQSELVNRPLPVLHSPAAGRWSGGPPLKCWPAAASVSTPRGMDRVIGAAFSVLA
jgi:hypothetical protein